MWWLRAKLLHIYSVLRSGKVEREIDEELRFHLEMRIQENLDAGLSPEEAERAARQRFGRVMETAETSAEVRRGVVLWGLSQDVRYALRSLRKNRGFTAVALLTLALGIGANAAIFSVIDAVLLRPLPYDDPDRLVMVWEDASDIGFARNTPAPANYADWKAQNRTFDDMAAAATRSLRLTGDGEPEQVLAYQVTANLLPMLGVEPAIGRTFLPEEDAPGASRVAVISHGLWQRRYGGDPEILGREILFDDEKYTVVGVMPAGFQFLENVVDVWVPIALDEQGLANRSGHYLRVVGRLRKDVSLDEARADIQTIMQRIALDYPDAAAGLGAAVVPLREQLAGDVERPLIVLLVAVGFVLLIACANIASLLLSRAANRRKEIAVRFALGAGRLRILQQLLTEGLLLAGAGGLAGLLLAYWSFAFLRQLIPVTMTLSTALAIDTRVLGFTSLLAVVTGIAFGLAPASQVTKIALGEALQQSAGRASAGARGGRLRAALIVTEVGLALVLLVGASLLIQTFHQLRGQYSGLQPENVLTLQTALPPGKYDSHQKRLAFYDEVLGRVRAIPGVLSAGYTTTVPLKWKGGDSALVVEGRPALQGYLAPDANHRQITADYLKTIGIQLERGRDVDERDTADSLPVAVINETMARQYWPDDDALGKRFRVGDVDEDRPWVTIVGIVEDVRQMGVDAPVKAEMYLPFAQTDYQQWFAPRDLVIRTAGDPASVVGAVRLAIGEVDPDQPISAVRTMDDLLGRETANRRVGMTLLAAFAALALLLASIGIYGLLSYFVVQHTPEIGVRLALGARPRDVLALVVRRGMKLVLVGTAVGLILSLALTRLISGLLFGVSSVDPFTFAAVPILLIGVALLACYIPARRAARVDPLTAIRHE